MRTKKYIAIILIVFLLGSCVEKEKQTVPQTLLPFKPALEQVVKELIDSLRNEIGGTKLVSIEFYYPNSYRRKGCEMKIFISDYYASAHIDGYTKIDSTTIAIYNLKDDIFELVNKNEITFFTDTIIGFKDTCVLWDTKGKQFLYKITEERRITRVSSPTDFRTLMPLRKPKCQGGLTYTLPEEYLFHEDSLQAEENLKYYQKEVEYYRKKR